MRPRAPARVLTDRPTKDTTDHPGSTARRKIDRFLFADNPLMAEHAILTETEDRPADGKFEVILFPHTAQWKMLL